MLDGLSNDTTNNPVRGMYRLAEIDLTKKPSPAIVNRNNNINNQNLTQG